MAMKLAPLRLAALLVAAVATGSNARAASGSPVERVVNLLKDLQTKLEMDEKQEQKAYDKYACWCEKTTKRKAEAIVDAQGDLRALGQSILSLKGRVATLASEIEQLAADIKANEEAQAEATGIRQRENAAYAAETAELKQAIAALQGAVEVLVGGTVPAGASAAALLQQTERSRSAIQAVVAKLPAKAALKPQQYAFLSEFLHSGTSEQYSPQSFTVQGILKDMYDTFATDLETATFSEATSNTKFEDFIATKTAEKKAMEAEKAAKEAEKAEAEGQLADTQAIYDDTHAQLEADTAFFDETKAACESKHDEWTTRSDLREEEIAGIKKALVILTSDDARALFGSTIKAGKEVGANDAYNTGRDIKLSFLQVRRSAGLAAEAAPAERAYTALHTQAVAVHSLRLAALAVQVREAKVGHFEKVVQAIGELIQTLKDEDTADIAKRDQCLEEYQKINSTVADLSWKIEKNIAKIDKLTLLIAQLTDEKVKTIAEIADVEEHIATIKAQRQQDNGVFLKSKEDDQKAIDLLMTARAALASYYKNHTVELGPIQGSVQGLALQQQPDFQVSADQAPEAQFSDKGAHKNEAKGVLQIMTMIIEDLNDEIKNAMKDEETAQLEFEKQLAAAEKLKEELIAKKVSLEEAIAKRTEERDLEENDKATNEADLKNERDYYTSIHTDCDWILSAFDKRAAARAAEMQGLVGAKEFLAGYKPPALLEQPPAVFDDRALSRVRFLGIGR